MAIVGKTSASPGYRLSRNLLTGLLLVFVIYSLAPVFYLVVAATKSNNDLFTSFGFWFADWNLDTNYDSLMNWTQGLSPAAGIQANECPDGTMATLARGHEDITRCMPI